MLIYICTYSRGFLIYNYIMDSMLNIDNFIENNIQNLSLKDLGLEIDGINKFNSLTEYFDAKEQKKNNTQNFV